MHAPGSSESIESVPWPDPDDHVVEPETRKEMVDGVVVEVSPARPGHGDTHCRLDAVVRLHTAQGYIASSDLLTRRDRDNDFATDTSVRKAGTNPRTHKRYLEEIAFEVFHTQSRKQASARAFTLIRTGMRRVFGLFVDARSQEEEDAGRVTITVEEWLPGEDHWVVLDPESHIEDPVLEAPLPVALLASPEQFDAGLSSAAMRVLVARRHPEIARLTRASRSKGRKEGKRSARRADLLLVLDHRGIALTPDQRVRIAACDNQVQLDQWFLRALSVNRAAQLFV